jgi:hypothetical protein
LRYGDKAEARSASSALDPVFSGMDTFANLLLLTVSASTAMHDVCTYLLEYSLVCDLPLSWSTYLWSSLLDMTQSDSLLSTHPPTESNDSTVLYPFHSRVSLYACSYGISSSRP